MLGSLILLLCIQFGVLRGHPWAASSEESNDLRDSPWFCHSLDCPKYTLVKEYETFEERNYTASRWMTTRVEGKTYKDGVSEGFWRLFMYIDGNNDAGQKIPMTAPVLVRVTPKGDTMEKNFTESFFVPFATTTPPKPKDSRIYPDNLPAQTVYVKSFDGYASMSDYITRAKALAENLRKAGKSFNETSFMTAGYDPPFRIWHRHNEVWFFAQ